MMCTGFRPEGGGDIAEMGTQDLCSGLGFSFPTYSHVSRHTDIGGRQTDRRID